MNLHPFLLVAALAAPLAFSSLGTGAPLDALSDDWIVHGHEVLDQKTKTVDGAITIPAGAILELRGATLKVGHHIQVEPGGELRMGPGGGKASQLLPTTGQGFYVTVNGTATSVGEPRTIVRGLSGDGLSSVVLAPGGFKVHGRADLRDIVIHDGTAGLIVATNGSLHLERAEFFDLYLMGLAVQNGHAVLEDVYSHDSIIGVTGKGSRCLIEIRNSTLRNWAANLQMNACDTAIEGSRLEGASNNLISGGAQSLLQDTQVSGYQLTGFRLESGAGLLLERTEIEAGEPPSEWDRVGPEDAPQSGIVVTGGARLVVANSTITGNDGDGIRVENGLAAVENTNVTGNTRYGVRVEKGAVDLRGSTSLAPNGVAPMSHQVSFNAMMLDPDGEPLFGLELKILDAGGQVVFEGKQTQKTGLPVAFEAFGMDAEGNPLSRGPFTYEATSNGTSKVLRGPIDPFASTLEIRGRALELEKSRPWVQWTLGLGGVALLVTAIVWRRRSKAGAP